MASKRQNDEIEDQPNKRQKIENTENKSTGLKRRSEDEQEAHSSKKRKGEDSEEEEANDEHKHLQLLKELLPGEELLNKSLKEQNTENKSTGSKRRSEDEQSAHSSKKRKGEDSEEEIQDLDYFSHMPTEMLQKIFGFLKPGEGTLKTLTETCKRFEAICKPRLVLRVDFDCIAAAFAYPTFAEAYKEIKLYGREIDNHRALLKSCLRNSRHSVKSLKIGRGVVVDHSYYSKGKITLKTLMSVLRYFRNLSEVTICSMQVLPPQISLFNSIRDEEYSELPNLRKLHLSENSIITMSVFKKVTGLTELIIDGYPGNHVQIRNFVLAQTNLEVLRAELLNLKLKKLMPKLTTIESSFLSELGNPSLNFAPNLKHIKVTGSIGRSASWMMEPLKQLETIELYGITGEEFDVQAIRPLYPSLKKFKSQNFEWRKGEAKDGSTLTSK